ncbi:sigma 54-interacting transcriptional regulator [candidate division WOR-3 bacterium]|nr:sigma 54-interacting transcriptional regulator [candidate division WOR-3 bacterium]
MAKQDKSKLRTHPGKLTFTRPKSLVGRKEELTLLKEEFSKLGENPHKPIIIISGEAGIGKTRLLEEIDKYSRLKNAIFIKVECQREEEESYAPFRRIIKSLINLLEVDYKEFIKVYGDMLITLSPDLRNKEYLRKVKHLKEIEKHYILERFLQFLINLPLEKNIVIALEDFQYSGKETIEFLKYLALGMPVTSNIIFIITYREEEKTDKLIEFEEAIKGYFIKILLERLSIQSTREFITSMIDVIEEDAIESILDKTFKKTAGIPLFIEHFVRLLIEGKALTKEEDTCIIDKDKLSGIELTGTILQIIQEKLERVPNKKLMRVIQYASIMGGEYIDSVILNEIMDKDIRRELKVLNNQWILRKETIEGKERFKFAHPMIKEVAYRIIPGNERKKLHKKVGPVLEKHFPLENAILAQHFSLAEVRGKAYKYSLKAAKNAEKEFAYLESIPLYETALRFATDKSKMMKIRIKLAEVCGIVCNFKKSIKYLKEVISQEEQNELRIKAMVELMKINRLQGKNKEAFKIGEGVLKLISKDVSIQKAQVYKILGRILIAKGEHRRGINYLKEALLISVKLGDKELQAETKNAMGLSYTHRDRCNIAIKYLKEALELTKSKKTRGVLYLNLGVTYGRIHNHREEEFYFKKAIELSRETGDIKGLAIAYHNLALILQSTGRSNDALKYFRYALEYTKRMEDKIRLSLIYANIGGLYAQINELDLAIEYCNKSLELIKHKEYEDIRLTVIVYINVSVVYFYRGVYNRAIFYCKKLMKLEKKINNLSELNEARILLSNIYVNKGDFEKAENLLLKAEEYIKDKKDNLLLGLSHRVRAKIIKNDSPEEAIRYFKDSLKAFSKPYLKTEKAHTLYEMGRLYIEMNKYQDALDTLLQANGILQERGEIYWLKKVENSIEDVEKLLQVLPKRMGLEIDVLTPIVKLISSKVSLDRFIEEALILVKNTLQIGMSAVIVFEDGDIKKVYSNEEIDKETRENINNLCKLIYNKKKLILNQKGLILCIPIKVEETIKGVLYMDNRENQNRFERDTIEFLKLLSSIFSIGIENLKLRGEPSTKFSQKKKVTTKFGNIIGESKAMQKVYNLIKSCAGSDIAVLLEGETGVGKELVAKAIHFHSKRKGNFVPIYCGGMPYSLFEGEFFGYKKGAFTGAIHDKPGLLEEADGGTIFLDEITSIPLPIQAKLLRVLQEGNFRRLGETKHKKVDVRIISAINQDIEELITRGEFRKDLFYRITTIRMKIPSLRERKEDIPLLVNYYLEIFNKKFGRDIKGFTGEAMNTMTNYTWEGNVRELEHEIERLVAITEEEIITIDDLKEEIRETRPIEIDKIVRLDEFIKERECEYIALVLKQCNYNMSKAAKLLKIGRTTLYRKIEELQILKNQDNTQPLIPFQ